MKVIIIEDEPLIAKDIQRKLTEHSVGFEIQAVLYSVHQSLCYFEDNPLPDLFFSDIRLGDGLSFDIFSQLDESPPVIFCTAHDDYALEAFRRNGIDYLLKPLRAEDLERAIGKLSTMVRPRAINYQVLRDMIINGSTPTKRLLAYSGDRIIPLEPATISCIQLINGITYVNLMSTSRYVLAKSLDELEAELGENFFRANRQTIVQRAGVLEINRYSARKLLVKVTGKQLEPIVISKGKASAFLEWLTG